MQPSLSWPTWLSVADAVAAVLLLALVFLLASFAARNSDLWVHLAAGQRLLRGEYWPGSDPFSYAAAERVWVQHSLLFDVAAYLLYMVSPPLLVATKAAVVAAAFALILSLRRRGHAAWPWVMVGAVAALAAAPQLLLRPYVLSLLFAAVSLRLLLTEQPRRRHAVALIAVFWLWALSDQWFFVGPLMAGLLVIGEGLQRLGKEAAEEEAAALPSPPLRYVAAVFGLGIVACTLTPFHVRIWELPVELTGVTADDPRLRQLSVGPLDRLYYTTEAYGRNLNGLAYAALLVGGGVALGFGVGSLRLGQVALWLGLAILSLWSVQAIPFLALVATPVIAAQLNQISGRVRLQDWQHRPTRLVLIASQAGRLLGIGLLVAAVVLAWAGWLHPPAAHPVLQRRVAWTIDPDPVLVRAAQQLQAWRDSGRLPPEARGYILSLDLANYCAWFAPSEKVFVNSRYTHHRREMQHFSDVRGALGLHPRDEEQLGTARAATLLEPWNVEYVALHFNLVESRLQPELTAVAQQLLWRSEEQFRLWYLDGRTTIGGWRRRAGAESPRFAGLALDPVELAFGGAVAPLPAGVIRDIPPQLGWEADFVRPPQWPHPGIDATFGWVQYARLLEERYQQRQLAALLAAAAADQMAGGAPVVSVPLRAVLSQLPVDEAMLAVPILALRAARQAAAAQPDDPDVYAAIAEALALPRQPLSPDERTVARVTALRQCLARMPPPERLRRGQHYASPTMVATQLAALYLGERSPRGVFLGMPVNLPAFHILRIFGATGSAIVIGGQLAGRTEAITLLPLDVARDTLQLARRYAEADPQLSREQGRKLREQITEFARQVDEETRTRENLYEREKLRLGPQVRPGVLLSLALQHNLAGEAIRLLENEQLDYAAEFQDKADEVTFTRIVLLTVGGRLEDAAGQLTATATRLEANPRLRDPVRWLRYQLAVFAGDYGAAGSILEDFAAASIGQDPPLPPELAWLKPAGLARMQEALPLLADTAYVGQLGLDLLVREQLARAVIEPFQQWQQLLRLRRVGDAEYFWRRGYLYLVAGDIVEAQRCFENARRPGVPAWGVADVTHPQAEAYRRVLVRRQTPRK